MFFYLMKLNNLMAMHRLTGGLKRKLGSRDGVGTIEIVLILVVLIGLVLIFKNEIRSLLSNIFTEINDQTENIY